MVTAESLSRRCLRAQPKAQARRQHTKQLGGILRLVSAGKVDITLKSHSLTQIVLRKIRKRLLAHLQLVPAVHAFQTAARTAASQQLSLAVPARSLGRRLVHKTCCMVSCPC